jgi:nucleoside-diphosphate-sugar epimerase
MRKALVCGAGGFIGAHLARRLVGEGYWVRGADLHEPEFSPSAAQEFVVADLRERDQCARALEGGFDEVYQLAADMGGMGFIHSAVCEIMRNNVLINVNVVDAAAEAGVERYFYSSSVCVYRDMALGEPELAESEAYPALPDNEYGWEKLYSERVVRAYGERHGFATRVARFQNTYGPEGTWRGGREKAPAAICRKVAEAPDGGDVEVWGDGRAVRSYTYVDDLLDGIRLLMASDHADPVNIGNPEYVSVNDLVATVAEVAGKDVRIRHVDGPVGVQSRNFANGTIEGLGFGARYPLRRGIERTYPWVAAQVEAARAGAAAG